MLIHQGKYSTRIKYIFKSLSRKKVRFALLHSNSNGLIRITNIFEFISKVQKDRSHSPTQRNGDTTSKIYFFSTQEALLRRFDLQIYTAQIFGPPFHASKIRLLAFI